MESSSGDSLIIPVQSSSSSSENKNLFIEIFPEELKDVAVSTILKVLQDEKADLSTWADAAVHYMQQKHARESLTLLQTASELDEKNVRILASTGIAHLSSSSSSNTTNNNNEETRHLADQKFTQAAALDTFFPMTWMGRGMLNLNAGRAEQAQFFFQTTVTECGPVLPGLLGMAAVLYGEGKYAAAQTKYGEAIQRYPDASGAAARVGFGLASYQLGQVDRARAAFARALAMDPEHVPAMVGAAVLDTDTEQAVKRMSMANLLDHSNAMVQNHLANHYFWKWTAVTGTVTVETGSDVMTASQPMPLEAGDPVRIGTTFEATVVEDIDDTQYRLSKKWSDTTTTTNGSSGLKIWKKDYERVFALAKGAYSSTTVPEMQAESLFFLARVYHVRGDMASAHKCYRRACNQAPGLTPARFGLAQTLVAEEKYTEAADQLQQLLATTASSNATDAYALLGLLRVRKPSTYKQGLQDLRKALELDPANPDLVVLEALALQQQRGNYAKALEGYRKAVRLMEQDNKKKKENVPFQIYTNMGVLCHETKLYDEALQAYRQALDCFKKTGAADTIKMQNTGVDGIRVVHPDNDMFFGFLDTKLQGLIDEKKSPTSLKVLLATTTTTDDHDVSSIFSPGEHIRIGESFVTEVVSMDDSKDDDGNVTLHLKDAYESNMTMMTNDENNEPEGETTRSNEPVSIFVKRENELLGIDEVTTIAFNVARLHEASGKTLAAIELHKAIAKRNPAYVNSYLRLACIAVDCGSLNECAQWLKIAAVSAPGNSEVLTLIGNLHLSLCDWKPAQKVFDGLMAQKIPSVEAYSALSMGNVYFANLHVSEQRYAKHLQYASDYYKRILSKDALNTYAANGIGTVLAEKGEIFKAKEVFNRVREVSGDSIADALLNLGHIYLALKKHPAALQLYKSYMKSAEDGTTPITSKSRTDDTVDVLLYIAFAYFDWARHMELFNDANAAEADGLYKQAMEHLELAIGKHSKKEVILRYNLCMTKLQAANCVLQKLTRNIPRTVEEVEEALHGLEESLTVVEGILKDKEEGEKKINIRTSILEDFLKHCKANIASAQSHLEDEKKRAEEEKAEQDIRRLAAEAAQKEAALREAIKKQEEAKEQEERDQKADAKMRKVDELRTGWQQENENAQAQKEKRGKKRAGESTQHPELEEDGGGVESHGLFDDSDDESDVAPPAGAGADNTEDNSDKAAPSQSDLFGDDSSDDENEAVGVGADEANNKKDETPGDNGNESVAKDANDSTPAVSNQDLFGDSDDEESDEELVPTDAASKRPSEKSPEAEDGHPKKKRRVLEDDDEE